MLALGLALRARGHSVTMIVNGYFRELSESLDLPTIEFGTRDEFLQLIQDPGLWEPTRSLSVIFRTGVQPTMREHFDLIAEQLNSTDSPVMISNVWGLGARVAHDKFGVPLVTLNLQPSAIWSDINPPELPLMFGPNWLRRLMFRVGEKWVVDRVVCPELNAWRSELDLPPVSKIVRWWQSPWCVANFFPAWFASPPDDWPKPYVQSDFPLWDQEPDAELSAELKQFIESGMPPIVFTPGSANVHGGEFFRTALQACERLEQRALFVTRFDEQLPAELPANVLRVPFVPFSTLLPHAGAIVHHGGIGTMSQAMRAGTPQLITALAYDQFDNLRRCQKLQIADGFGHARLNPSRLTHCLARLLSDPNVKTACMTVAQRLQHSNGPDQLAAAIEARYEQHLKQKGRNRQANEHPTP